MVFNRTLSIYDVIISILRCVCLCAFVCVCFQILNLLKCFQVFKADSINDSFLIGSGVPCCVGDKLGNRHVTEIVGLAFDLLNAFVLLNEFKNPKVNLN